MKKGLAICFVLLAAVVLLAPSCAKKEEKPAGKTPKDTLVVAMAALPTGYDADFAGNIIENAEAHGNMFDNIWQMPIQTAPWGVLQSDTSQQPTGLLSEKYERSPDGRKWTVTLKKGVKSYWGNELTAEDVKWSFERSVAVEGNGTWNMLAGGINMDNPITVRDKYTFDINLVGRSPVYPLVDAIPLPLLTIKDATEVKKHTTATDPWAKEWLATHTAGFAPYHLDHSTPGVEALWVANPNYHVKGLPKLKKILVREVPDPATRAALLIRGEVDMAMKLGPRQLEEVAKSPGVVVDSTLGNHAVIFGLNNNVPPLDNVKVRQAIAYAVPTQDIIKTVFLNNPFVKVAPGYVPEYYPGALKPEEWPYKYDLEKAKALLREAGVGPFSFELAYNSAQTIDEEIAVIIKTALAKLGIDVLLQKLAPAKYQEQYYSRKAVAVLVEDAAWFADGAYAFGLYFYSGTGGIADWTNYKNPQVDALLDKANATGDLQERYQLAYEAHKIIVSEAPWVFYLHMGYHLARRDNVRGFVWRTNNLLEYKWFYKE